MKKNMIYALFFMLLGCSSQQFNQQYTCPKIIIPRATTRAYYSDINDKVQINLVGHESHCYQDDDKRYYAVITPIFKVRRLEYYPTTNFDANYYIKTSINDKDYIGRKVFQQTVNIPKDVKEVQVKGAPAITRISNPPYNKFKIYIGMDLSGAKKEKSKKMFDMDYRYFTEEEINSQNETAIDRVNLEVLPDEEIIYSEELQKPIVVKKNRPKNSCQN